VTAGLGAFHVIDQRAYEDALNAPTALRALLWLLRGPQRQQRRGTAQPE
jgi:hypothetical protein